MALEFTDFLARIIASVVLGAIIGVEREYHKRPAGVLTLPLVALASALMTIVSFSAPGNTNSTTIVAGIASGIGFIGAGAILKVKDTVHGITTAASIWVVAALGMACGFGYFAEAAATAVLGVLVILVGYPIKDYLESKPNTKRRRD